MFPGKYTVFGNIQNYTKINDNEKKMAHLMKFSNYYRFGELNGISGKIYSFWENKHCFIKKPPYKKCLKCLT